jgi:hypothetical protein
VGMLEFFGDGVTISILLLHWLELNEGILLHGVIVWF